LEIFVDAVRLVSPSLALQFIRPLHVSNDLMSANVGLLALKAKFQPNKFTKNVVELISNMRAGASNISPTDASRQFNVAMERRACDDLTASERVLTDCHTRHNIGDTATVQLLTVVRTRRIETRDAYCSLDSAAKASKPTEAPIPFYVSGSLGTE
jgi:hypothetical protein